GRQIDPTAEQIIAESRYGNRLASAAIHKKSMSCWIEPDTRETKVERFISARFVITDIRQITECDPRCQLTARPFEIKLMRKHFAVGKRLVMIDRKSTRLNSSHVKISYAVFC